MLFEGETNRSMSEHQLNKSSTRSHCIFTIYVESRSRVESSEKVLCSKLNLVDLAGSERLSKTETKGITLKEAMYINRSLTYLEQVIIALSDKKRDHVPFRQSKMTHVLKDSLGGNCNTLMIANIWGTYANQGEKQNIEETISTLRFATRMMCVTVNPEVNVHYDPLALIKKYEREIRELKQELSMYDTLSNRSQVTYETYTELQKAELAKQIKSFIDNEQEEIEIINIRQIKECLAIFRHMYKSLEESAEEGAARRKSVLGRDTPVDHEPHPKPAVANADREEGVGDMEGTGFGVGLAPLGKHPTAAAKQLVLKQTSKSKPKATSLKPEDDDEALQVQSLTKNALADVEPKTGETMTFVIDQTQMQSRKGQVLSRAEEFEIFKKGKGAEMTRILVESKALLKSKKKQAKELAERINEIKQQMDTLKTKLSVKKAMRSENASQLIMDEQECSMLEILATHKETYKQSYQELNTLRADIEYLTRTTDQYRQKNMTEFENWFETRYGGQDEHLEKDVLDIGEKFDKLAMEKMSQEDPNSLPFYNAKKNTERKNQKVTRRVQLRPLK